MFTFNIENWVPKFILGDKNGYALAKAIEAAMQRTNAIVRQGLDCLLDYDTMPEWRLDELAWELNCLYDYSASIETKREWIKNAIPYYRLFGTPKAIYRYLDGYFGSIELEEFWQYGGDPFHFRLTLGGIWTDDREAWARKAIAAAKNVRSVLDSLAAGAFCDIAFDAQQVGVHRFQYPMTSTLLKTGTKPRINTIGVLDDSEIDADAEGQGHHFPYPMTGTRPDVSTMGFLDNPHLDADAEGQGHRFPYPMTGTTPGVATMGFDDNPQVDVDADATGYPFPYNMPGEGKKTGTKPSVSTMGEITQGTIRADNDGEVYAVPYKMCGRDTL